MSQDKRTRIERLLNYKRYIDFLIEEELLRVNESNKLKVSRKKNKQKKETA